MRYFDEIKTTTHNYVWNRLRIPYDSICGWCSPGSRCCKRQKQKWYHVNPNSKRPDNFPSWKLVSKNKKQWMKKPTWKKKFKYNISGEEAYEIKWNGNNMK